MLFFLLLLKQPYICKVERGFRSWVVKLDNVAAFILHSVNAAILNILLLFHIKSLLRNQEAFFLPYNMVLLIFLL